MRRVSAILVAFGLSTALVTAGPLPDASAITAGPPCVYSHGLCTAALKIAGDHHWRLLIAGPMHLYFRRYRLCVQAPDGSLACDVFRTVRTTHHHFASMIIWSRHFPNRGPGRYSARWRLLPSHRLIAKRGFTVG